MLYMKRVFIIVSIILTVANLCAQPPGGGRGTPGGPPPGGGGREMGNRPNTSSEELVLEHFPEIPDLTLKQREKIGTVLVDERKDIQKQLEKKLEIEKNRKPDASEKDLEKQHEKIAKIDQKIQDIKSKADKKVKKLLSDEQYLVLIEKRGEFKFKQQNQRPRFRRDSSPDTHSVPLSPSEHERFE